VQFDSPIENKNSEPQTLKNFRQRGVSKKGPGKSLVSDS